MSTCYVGNLSSEVTRSDLEKEAERAGRVRNVDVKSGFAFVEFDDPKDAASFIQSADGLSLHGRTINVQEKKGSGTRDAPGRARDDYRGGGDRYGGDRYGGDRYGGDRYGGGGGGYDDRRGGGGGYDDRRGGGGGGGYGGGRGDRTFGEWRVYVENLDDRTSWQDLKDVMRERAGRSVASANVYRDGDGSIYAIVEFRDEQDYHSAIRNVDGTRIDGATVRVKADKSNPDGGRPDMGGAGGGDRDRRRDSPPRDRSPRRRSPPRSPPRHASSEGRDSRDYHR